MWVTSATTIGILGSITATVTLILCDEIFEETDIASASLISCSINNLSIYDLSILSIIGQISPKLSMWLIMILGWLLTGSPLVADGSPVKFNCS
jgi:hypothetical protein